MSDLYQWSRTPASNNDPPPNGAPEGWFGADVNNTVRQIMAELAEFYYAGEWRRLTYDLPPAKTPKTVTRTNDTTVTIANCDATAQYPVGARILLLSATQGQAVITNSQFTGGSTVLTVDRTLPAGPYPADGVAVHVAPTLNQIAWGEGGTITGDTTVSGQLTATDLIHALAGLFFPSGQAISSEDQDNTGLAVAKSVAGATAADDMLHIGESPWAELRLLAQTLRFSPDGIDLYDVLHDGNFSTKRWLGEVTVEVDPMPTGDAIRTEPHGVTNPRFLSLYWECKTSDGPYNPGDQVPFAMRNGDQATDEVISVALDATNLIVRSNNWQSIFWADGSGGAHGITNSRWKLVAILAPGP